MFVLALCVATLCARGALASQDTTAAPAIDTIRAGRAAPSPAPPQDSTPSPADPRQWRRLSDIPDTLRAYVDVRAYRDTVSVRRRKKVVMVEYSDWYSRRLTIHRWASYATLPLFAGNYLTGRELFEHGDQAPAWATRYHGTLAGSVATLFGVNTLTGGWNLWDGRNDPNGRGWRMTHALLMLGADAGFTTAGLLANQAERSDQRRRLHRTVALTSVGVSLLSYAIMLPPFRRN